MLNLRPAPFRDRALCRGAGVDVFVPLMNDHKARLPTTTPTLVQRLCPTCPVRSECEAYGRSTRSYGWWGGLLLVNGATVEEWKRWDVRPEAEQRCVVCGNSFTSTHLMAVYCGKACQMREHRANKKAGIKTPRQLSPAEMSLVCVVCQKPFTAKRADALYCCNACAQVTRVPSKVGVTVTISLLCEVA